MIRDKKAVILLNKSDLSTVVDKKALETLITKPMIDISAKEETGIHELESTLKEMFYHGDISFNDEVYITNIRHKTALADALSSLKKVAESIENQMPEDFFTIDLMDAYESLGSITGETIGEDLVNEIFRNFCMGKLRRIRHRCSWCRTCRLRSCPCLRKTRSENNCFHRKCGKYRHDAMQPEYRRYLKGTSGT